MKRVLVVALAVLAMPGVAQAKELTGFKLCGASGCAGVTLTSFGHKPPFDSAGAGMTVPPPGAFYVLRLEIDGHPDAWPAFYEPRSGLAAYRTEQAWMMWNRLTPPLAKLARRLARKVEPFPTPSVTRVRIAGRGVSGDVGSYLTLFELDAARAVPRTDETDVIDVDAAAPNPWTDAQLLYYPDEDILQVSAGRTIRLPSELAEDVEAARPLFESDGSRAWVSLALPLVGAGGLGAALFAARRRRLRS